MNAHLLAKIALRVLSVYIMARGIMELPNLYTISLYAGSVVSEMEAQKSILYLAVVSPVVVGLALWFLASPLSSLVVGPEAGTHTPKNISVSEIQAVVIATVGFILFFFTVPGFVGLMVQLYGTQNMIDGERIFNSNTLSYVLSSGLKLLLGLLLIMGARFWVRLLTRFREFGLESKSSNK